MLTLSRFETVEPWGELIAYRYYFDSAGDSYMSPMLEIYSDWEDGDGDRWSWSLDFGFKSIMSCYDKWMFDSPEAALDDFLYGNDVSFIRDGYVDLIDKVYDEAHTASRRKTAMGRKSKDQVERELEDAGYRFCAYEYDGDAQYKMQSLIAEGYDAKLLREKSDTRGLKMFSVWVKDHPRFTTRYSSNKNATRHFTYAEMQELDDEIEGRELHNANRLRYTTGTELA